MTAVDTEDISVFKYLIFDLSISRYISSPQYRSLVNNFVNRSLAGSPKLVNCLPAILSQIEVSGFFDLQVVNQISRHNSMLTSSSSGLIKYQERLGKSTQNYELQLELQRFYFDSRRDSHDPRETLKALTLAEFTSNYFDSVRQCALILNPLMALTFFHSNAWTIRR